MTTYDKICTPWPGFLAGPPSLWLGLDLKCSLQVRNLVVPADVAGGEGPFPGQGGGEADLVLTRTVVKAEFGRKCKVLTCCLDVNGCAICHDLIY